jgi:Protein of unknown function (DUF3078)
MRGKIQIFLVVIVSFLYSTEAYSQIPKSTGNIGKVLPDSLSGKGVIFKTTWEKPVIKLSKEQAIRFLQNWHKEANWNNPADPLREAIGQLLFYASNNPFDSTRAFLDKYSYDSINIPWDKFYVWDTIRVKIPVINASHFNLFSDSLFKADTIFKKILNDSLKKGIAARLTDSLSHYAKFLTGSKDTVIIVARDTIHELSSPGKGFPFRKYNWPYESDSILVAIKSLVSFVENRDSSVVNLSGTSILVTPVWLNSKSNSLVKFWLRNEYSDSVTLWAGSVSKNTIGLYLEEGIIFRRPMKQLNFSNAQIALKQINSKDLLELRKAEIRPIYWKLHSEASFILNQASLTNWVKGGESSISGATDITGYADYNNKKLDLLSNDYIRLKYGLIKSGDRPLEKNTDLLETNSKINHKAFGKFDFSAIMLFKTQISKGFNYPNDSVPVSKFLNPGVFTFGLGLDFKPNKTTSVNFSPLSYKVTFVTDTGKAPLHIDQTLYGIPHGKKSLQEPGASLLITNEFKPVKTVAITNRLQLFTNYIHNPQNIDVDWEMIATVKLNWFTDMRFNTNLIYDDKTKTAVVDKHGKPVLDEFGNPKKSARIQFKELLGFSFVFRF